MVFYKRVLLRKYCLFFLFFFQFVFLFSQEKLSSREQVFLSRQITTRPVLPRDMDIGLMEDNSQIRDLIEDFIINGPQENNSVVSLLPILGVKYLPLTGKKTEMIRISKNMIADNRYKSDLKVVTNNILFSCTIYLVYSTNQWYIEDFFIN